MYILLLMLLPIGPGLVSSNSLWPLIPGLRVAYTRCSLLFFASVMPFSLGRGGGVRARPIRIRIFPTGKSRLSLTPIFTGSPLFDLCRLLRSAVLLLGSASELMRQEGLFHWAWKSSTRSLVSVSSFFYAAALRHQIKCFSVETTVSCIASISV